MKMKKHIYFILFIGLIFIISLPVSGKSNEKTDTSDYQVIPDDAIRLRILADSNSEQDQALKRTVRDAMNEEIDKWVEELNDIDEARHIIENNIPILQKIVGDVLEEENANPEFTVEYSDNVTFPAKLYGNYIYPAGEYEAVLVTLGEGDGDNWWCVLFPPLCFMDFSSGSTAEETEEENNEEALAEDEENGEEEAEVKFFLLEWLSGS